MLESGFAEHKRFDLANEALGLAPGDRRMTVTLPSLGRLVLALMAIALVFVLGMAVGRRNRPAPPRVGPVPVSLQSAAAAPSPTVTAPGATPPLPALQEAKPRVPAVSTRRSRPVV
jgi:hypothetical protein